MVISEVRIKLAEPDPAGVNRIRAFATMTVDDMLAVRDIKVIRGDRGPFLSMPSRKVMARCPRCESKNPIAARFCMYCAFRLSAVPELDANGRAILHADVAHPVNHRGRDVIHAAVIGAYEREVEMARQPGYTCRFRGPCEDAPEAPAGGRDDYPLGGSAGRVAS